MQFRLILDSDNAAFTEDAQNEVVRIIREAADKIEDTPRFTNSNLRDINGNTVGFAELITD